MVGTLFNSTAELNIVQQKPVKRYSTVGLNNVDPGFKKIVLVFQWWWNLNWVNGIFELTDLLPYLQKSEDSSKGTTLILFPTYFAATLFILLSTLKQIHMWNKDDCGNKQTTAEDVCKTNYKKGTHASTHVHNIWNNEISTVPLFSTSSSNRCQHFKK